MAKPNPDCELCHGTGWQKKPDNPISQRPCPICSQGQPATHPKRSRKRRTLRPTYEDEEKE